MTDCNRCGACCEVIFFPKTKKETRARVAGEDALFIEEHWHRIARAEAERRNMAVADVSGRCFYYECDHWDPETRLCRAGEEKPPICRGFPWYGRPDGPVETTYALEPFPTCSFWADVPRDRWPQYVVAAQLR
jgi:Fe-S-cluster containining protein